MGVIRKKTARSGEGGVKYVCDVCSADITSTVRIRCAVCSDYDLCVQCFSSGASSNAHKPETHSYRVIEQNSFPIFDPDWGADEELLLIEGCEIYGLGSWADVADHIGGYRTKDEVREHYYDVYVRSSSFPLPERCSPHDRALADETTREEFQARKKRRIEERREASKSAPVLQPKTKPTVSGPTCHEIGGYMPGRLEFEVEYANEAEEAVQLMQFDMGDGINPKSGDTESELDLKLTVMEIYNCRLTQRADRKKVIFEHNLLDYRENQKLEKRRTKEEKDLFNRAKPFARMMNHADFEDFTQGLVDELNLRQAIGQLQEWRARQIGDLRSGEKYEQEKFTRQQKTQPMGSMDRDRLAVSQRGKAPPPPEPRSGAALLVAPELPIRVNGAGSATNGDAGAGANASSGVNGTGTVTNGTHILGAFNSTDPYTNDVAQPPEAYVNGVSSAAPTAKQNYMPPPLPGVNPLPLAPDTAPDLHLLTREEVGLCEALRIKPKPYLMIKEQILKEALKGNGMLKKKQAREICRLDGQKGGRIFDFFVNSGWIGRA